MIDKVKVDKTDERASQLCGPWAFVARLITKENKVIERKKGIRK